MMNLVTGATGLVGAHVALQLLQQGKVVCAIKRDTSDVLKTKKLFSYYSSDFDVLFRKITWIEADLLDIYSLLDALKGIDTVYHCAGLVSFNPKQKKQLNNVNSIGTTNLVNACLEKNISAFCHVSSIATLQNPDITLNIDESVFWKSSPSASDYAISKYNSEREVWRAIEEGLPAVIVNPGIIIGPGFWQQSSGKLISNCYKGNSFYSLGSSATIDARDVAKCMIQLVEKKQFSKRFILIENNYSFKEILSKTHLALGRKIPYLVAGKNLLILAKWINKFISLITGKETMITKETIESITEHTTFSNLQIKEVIHYQFTPLDESLTFVCNAFLKDLKHQ